MEAVHVFERDVVPVVGLVWVTGGIHEAAVGAHLVADRRALSLVDCASFEVMRRTGVRTAFRVFPFLGADFGFSLDLHHFLGNTLEHGQCRILLAM